MYSSSQSPIWSQLCMFMYVLSTGGYAGFIFRLVVSPLQELSQYEKAPKGVTVRNLFSRHPVMIRGPQYQLGRLCQGSRNRRITYTQIRIFAFKIIR
uniref:Uncharacterized protein n=1 Tax=Aegilops tauschii subsp. strangulata TaxID=200361 RepID=A0A453GEI2_AEGTS